MKKSVLSAMVVLLLLGVAAYAAFFVAPTDAKQGVIYRILYLHVASAWTGLTSFFICFIANLLYVLRRQPRWDWLTSTFVLWLLYVSYLLLRTLVEEHDRRALLSALFGIFAFIDVPLVFGSIRWWRTQHPQPIIMGAPGSGLDPTMYKVLFFTWFAMLGLMTLLLRQRYRLEAMRGDLEIIQHGLEAA